MLRVLLLVALCLYAPVDGHKILVTCLGASASQNLIMYRLADMLGARGNDVTVLKWELFSEAKGIKLEYAKEIVYPMILDGQLLDQIRAKSGFIWADQSVFDIDFSFYKKVLTEFKGSCSRFLNDTTHPVHKQFMSTKYDAIVIHTFDFCSFGLAKVVNNPSTIWMSTAFMLDPLAKYSGVPYPASYVPTLSSTFTDKMTLPQRIRNFIQTRVFTSAVEYFFLSSYTEFFRAKYGDDFPSIPDLMRETQLYFINADPFFEYARPTQHNIIYMGGITMEKPEPMNEEWTKLLENAPGEGIVVFSLGSVARTEYMPMEKKEALVKAFAKFPQFTFFFRIDGDVPTLPENVRHIGWMPQKELLGHPKVKAFLTHGGFNSLTEATFLGVPLIMLPLMSDQYGNAKRVERLGLGVTLDKYSLTVENIERALSTVLLDKGYKERAMRLAQMIQQKPVQSADLALKWVEFLAQFRTVDNLLPESRHMGWIQYYSLDVISILILAVFLIFFLMCKLVCCCCCRCCRRSSSSSVDAQKKRKRE
uniref:glucuronosyltransferase n=1 Tax=Plectus sambesii TaxID=2011161 RepID=A0A914X8A0_9BILA